MQSIDWKMGISVRLICIAKHILMTNNIVIYHFKSIVRLILWGSKLSCFGLKMGITQELLSWMQLKEVITICCWINKTIAIYLLTYPCNYSCVMHALWVSKDRFTLWSLLDLQTFEVFQGLYSSCILKYAFDFWLAVNLLGKVVQSDWFCHPWPCLG